MGTKKILDYISMLMETDLSFCPLNWRILYRSTSCKNQSYAFLRDHAEFDDLISEVKDIISSSPQPPTE